MAEFNYEIDVLRNPYRLRSRSLFLWLYTISDYLDLWTFSKLAAFLHLISSIWGFHKLKAGSRRRLDAAISFSANKSKGFTITELNSQFCSIYFKQYRDLYEADVESIIQKFFPENGSFVDVGSNWGYFSIKVASHYRSSMCYAYEPLGAPFDDIQRITKELSLHNLDSKNIGLSSSSGMAELWQDGFETGHAHLGKAESVHANGLYHRIKGFLDRVFKVTPQKCDAQIGTLDQQNLLKCDLIKIDVEGHELSVLQGAINTIRRLSPVIIFEHWHTHDAFADVKRFF